MGRDTRRPSFGRWLGTAAIALAVFAAATGCDWFNDPVEANLPPETTIVTCPSAGEVAAGDDVTLEWSGDDADGSIVRFEWTLDDTTGGETTETSLLIENVTEGAHVFEAWAVDDDGDSDPTPAVCAFTAASSGGLVDRVVLAELLTTKFCTYCWVAELALERAIHNYGRDQVCVIAYHYDDDPGIPPDPVANDDSNARGDYYYENTDVGDYYTVFPIPIFDGGRFFVGASDTTAAKAAVEFEIDLRRDIGSPLSLDVTGDISGGSGNVSVTVSVEDALTGGPNVLRMVVIEDGIVEGANHWDFVARDVLEDETLAVSAVGEEAVVVRAFTVDPEWNEDNLDVIVFVQDDSTAEILQAGRLITE
ncbi:MAG TPA: hypothetical protein VE960_00740 [bacterium]|nr:hypothetical protein [bacterium]